jgi:hypothetical protein
MFDFIRAFSRRARYFVSDESAQPAWDGPAPAAQQLLDRPSVMRTFCQTQSLLAAEERQWHDARFSVAFSPRSTPGRPKSIVLTSIGAKYRAPRATVASGREAIPRRETLRRIRSWISS